MKDQQTNKLKQYIREYVMYLYNAKIKDADLDFQWKHPSDVEHPIQQRDIAKPKLPPAFTRNRSTARPHF